MSAYNVFNKNGFKLMGDGTDKVHEMLGMFRNKIEKVNKIIFIYNRNKTMMRIT